MKCYICGRDVEGSSMIIQHIKGGHCQVINLCHECGEHQRDLIEEEKEAYE